MPFDLFTGLFFLAFFIILAMIVVQFVRGIAQWGRNNASPRLTVEATVVAKRERTWRNQNHHGTTYYATFQVESGDRMERDRLRHAGRGRPRPADLPGHPVPGV